MMMETVKDELIVRRSDLDGKVEEIEEQFGKWKVMSSKNSDFHAVTKCMSLVNSGY